MVDTKKPSAKDLTQTGKPSQRIIEFIDELRKRINQYDIDGVEGWREKMRIARNMRQGIKRITDYPYPGAPDIPLPETEKVTRKQKPRFVLAVTSQKKYMTIRAMEGIQAVTAEVKEMAKKCTLAMNFLFRRPQMEWTHKLTLNSDRFLEKGHCIFKCIEEYSAKLVNRTIDIEKDFTEEQLTEFKLLSKEEKREFVANRWGLDPEHPQDETTLTRILKEFSSGKKVIQFTTEEVASLPNVVVPPPEKVFVSKGTTDIDNATRITNEFFWSEQKLVELAHSDILIKDKVLKIIEEHKNTSLKQGDDSFNERVKDQLEGVDDSTTGGELYRIHETITWYQPDKNKQFEKWVFIYFADIADPEESLIHWGPYSYEFRGWNYVKYDNEILDDRYYSSRGVPEQIRAIQEFMEKSMNNMLIRDEVNNAPMYTVLNTANIESDTLRFIPGQRIDVNTHDDIKPLNQPSNVDVSSERINQSLKAYAEEYVGIADQLFRNATNRSGGKTLGEIQIGVGTAQFTASLDILNWIDAIRKVYEKVFYIMQERLTTPLVINDTVITREDFQFIPDITVNGSLEMADKTLQEQKAIARLQMARQGMADGIATREDLFNAYEDFYDKTGVKEPLDFITDPKEIARQQITALENQVAQVQNILQNLNVQVAEADNTLKQIENQTRRKNNGETPEETQRRAARARQAASPQRQAVRRNI